VQVGTIARPTGWADKDASWQSQDGKQTFVGKEVVSTGRNPWQVKDVIGTVTVKNRALTRVVVLDPNGMPIRTLPVVRHGGEATVKLPANAMYLVLE
jgi:hypothetical protein